MAGKSLKKRLLTNSYVFIAIVGISVAPLWVAAAVAQDSRASLPNLNPEALSRLVAELQSAPPPALDIRAGTELDDLENALGEDDIRQLTAPGIESEEPRAFSDVMDPQPRRRKPSAAIIAKQTTAPDEDMAPLDLTGLSPIEAAYSRRASQRLTLFGYDIFTGADVRAPAPATLGDNYTMGPGDRVLVVLRGANSRTQTYAVGDDGKLIVDDIRPITAAGRTLKGVSREIEQEIAARMMDTQAFVSLAKLRAVNVQVIGEVARRGANHCHPTAALLTH